VSALLRDWRICGLLFEDAGQLVHVVPHAANQDLMRCVAGADAPALVPALLRPTAPAPGTDTSRTLRCWRERDEEAFPEGMYLGEVLFGDDPAQTASDVVARGALHVALPGPVAIGRGDPDREHDDVRALTQVRELTGRGIGRLGAGSRHREPAMAAVQSPVPAAFAGRNRRGDHPRPMAPVLAHEQVRLPAW
jgi:hypothetical protein